MADADGSSLERLRKKLYSRKEQELGAFPRRDLPEHAHEVEEDWAPPPPAMPKKSRKRPILSTLLVVAIVFFIASLALASFFFFRGSTVVSSRNIDIEMKGPVSVGGGEELSLQITVTNRNATAIEAADLLIEYPEGTRSPTDLSVEQPRLRESIGVIEPGEQVEKTVRAVLFGEEGSDVSVKASLEYRVPGSNAIFFKEQTYDLVLSTAPLAVKVDAVEELTSGQETEFRITVSSNADTTVEDVLLVAEYPFGFEFDASSPRPIFTNSVWELGDIEPEGERVVRLRGTVSGENEDERVFRFLTGIRSRVDETQLETAFVTALHVISIERPFIGAELVLDGSTAPEYIARSGTRVRGDIRWFNNLPVQIFDGEIDVHITGAILDERTVEAQRGFYRSSDNTLFWARETNSELGTLAAGSSGTVSFSFEPFGLSSGQTFRNPEILLEVSIRGKRLLERNVPETVESSVVRRVKVATDLLLTSRAVYSTGPFQNTGPLPPQAERETTYTILWTVTNSHNDVSSAAVRATLPSYMRFANRVSPQDASVSFNEIGGEVLWSVGDMRPGDKRDVAFQVTLSPSVSQVGSAPVLVNEQVLSGTDVFTRTQVGTTRPSLTTRLSTDPNASSGHDRVVDSGN